MQTTPATVTTQDATETAEDMFNDFYADKVIDLNESRKLHTALHRTVQRADRANLTRALGVCAIRGGFGGQRYRRIVRDWEDMDDATDPDAA